MGKISLYGTIVSLIGIYLLFGIMRGGSKEFIYEFLIIVGGFVLFLFILKLFAFLWFRILLFGFSILFFHFYFKSWTFTILWIGIIVIIMVSRSRFVHKEWRIILEVISLISFISLMTIYKYVLS